jgi:MATE family, multidrug efflux pump
VSSAPRVTPGTETRPIEPGSTAALPIDPEGGAVAVAITAEHEVASVLHGSLARVVRRVALPAVASNLLMTLFASVDAYWVGTRLGAGGLAAVSTSIFWIWLVIAAAEMVSIGLTAVAARRYGERRPGEAARVVGEALIFALALGTALALVGAVAVDSLFAMMQTPAEVSRLGHAYLRTYLLGAPLIFGFFAVDAGFRASGDTRTPLVILVASTAATLALDPVLILGLFGLPRLGIVGAAIALLLTRGAAFLIGVVILVRRRMLVLGRVRGATLWSVARIGLPTALTGATFSVIYAALTRTTSRFGTPALAALGLGHRVESWLYMIGVGFGAAAAAIVGQNLGARQPERAARAGWLAMSWATVPAFVAALAAVVIPERLGGMFTSDAAVIAETANYLRIAALSQLTIASEIVLEGALGGAGDTVPPMLTSTSLTALRIPVAAWAAARWGIDGIWWTISLTAAARGLAMAALWRSGRWMRRSV